MQWSSPAFGFVRLSDAFTTGSSIMPQKRNPDAAELVRGKTGRVLGDFVALATVVKGLSLAYGRDLQEDKERVFDAADTLELSLAAMAAMVADLDGRSGRRCARAAEAGYPTATDLADWIVRVLKKPFREAHHIAGAIVKRAEELGVALDALPLGRNAEDRARHHQGRLRRAVAGCLGSKSRTSLGGTAPARVREQIAFWKEGWNEPSAFVCPRSSRFCSWPRCGVKSDLVKPDGQPTPKNRERSLPAAVADRPMNHFSYQERRAPRRRRRLAHAGRRGRHALLLLFDARRWRGITRSSPKRLPKGALIAFSVKANGNLAVLKTLARLGAGADVVSGGELKKALAAGIPAGRIVFSGVGKTKAEMRRALEAGIYQFNVESEPELEA